MEFKHAFRSAIVFLIATSLGLGFAWVIGREGVYWRGVPVHFLCALLAFGVNWLAFVPSALARSEKVYDLVGSLTYLTVTVTALGLSGPLDARAALVGGMVMVWCVRLGTFLFVRISQDKGDHRFEKIKNNPPRFLVAWTLQGVWVIFTSACALAVITNTMRKSPDAFLYVGGAVWLFGFAVEVVADRQKRIFRRRVENRGRFINSGLWSWSQHPNYFGEITLWTGMAIIALPVLQGGQWLSLFSPVFITLLLTKVSGINLLDRRAKEVWGEDPEYQAYRRRTSKLILWPPSPSAS